jgi:hypothetical protein
VKNLEQFLLLIGHRFSSSLQYIELPMELITADVLHELANKCPNLKYLTLDFSTAMQLHDFYDLNIFPCNLKMLCICLSEVIFLEGFMRRIYTYLSSLEVLQIIGKNGDGFCQRSDGRLFTLKARLRSPTRQKKKSTKRSISVKSKPKRPISV